MSTTTYERVIDQAAWTPGPTGPHALGPVLDGGTVSGEGSLSGGAVLTTGGTRGQGAPGQSLASAWARGRVAAGLSDEVEIGVEGAGSPLVLSVPLAHELPTTDGVLGRGGVQLRLLRPAGNRLRLGMHLEADGGTLPLEHSETFTVSTFLHDTGQETSSTTRTDRERPTWFWTVRSGVTGVLLQPGGWNWALTAQAESLPSFFGHAEQRWACTSYGDRTTAFAALNGHFGEALVVRSNPVTAVAGLRYAGRIGSPARDPSLASR